MIEATVSEIQSLSTHDGPGMRTTIFFKGCSLNCVWCHNPETIKSQPEVVWEAAKCIGCRECEAVCPEKAISFSEPPSYIIDNALCNNCGLCVAGCPSHALKTIGDKYTVDDLFNRILSDEKFIKRSNGGVTFSGGEPTLHYRFIKELSEKLKAENFHLSLDTCGMSKREAYEELLPFIDLVLFDIKEMDTHKHKTFTGAGNEVILNNLKAIGKIIKDKSLKTKVWVRTPIIPGMTDSAENISAIGEFLSIEMSGIVERWELLAFNKMCSDKYRKLGLKWILEEKELLLKRVAIDLLKQAKIASKDSCEVVLSGLTKN